MNRLLRVAIFVVGLDISAWLAVTGYVHYKTGEFVEGVIAQSRPRANESRFECPVGNEACSRLSQYASLLREQLREAEDDLVVRSRSEAFERFTLAAMLTALFIVAPFVCKRPRGGEL